MFGIGKKKSSAEAHPWDALPPYSIASPRQNGGILLSTVEEFPGFEITDFHGVVYGTSVRVEGKKSRSSLHTDFDEHDDPTAEVRNRTMLVVAAREEAVERMLQGVKEVGGNAAQGFRFDSGGMDFSLSGYDTVNMATICCYATAVTVRPRKGLKSGDQ